MTEKLESLNPITGDVVGTYPIDDATRSQPPCSEPAR